MKRNIILIGAIVAILAMGIVPVHGQKKVTEKKLIGTWKLVIDIEEELDEAREEENSVLGEIILRGVSGLVEGVMDNIDIYMEFRPDGELKILVNAFGEEDIDYSRWYINSRGELYIEDSENIDIGDEDYWLMEGNRLLSFEKGKKIPEENVYMTKIE